MPNKQKKKAEEKPDIPIKEGAEQEQKSENVPPEAEAAAPETEAPESPKTAENAPPDERYLRLNAEYVNYRNRTAREKEALWATVKLETATQFLPMLDNLERAYQSEAEDSPQRQGLEMIYRQCLEIFERLGAKEIEALGKDFDPKLMDAVMHVEDAELGENTVKQVFSKGFVMGDRVMRHASVVVAN